jgi:hypothetical protein
MFSSCVYVPPPRTTLSARQLMITLGSVNMQRLSSYSLTCTTLHTSTSIQTYEHTGFRAMRVTRISVAATLQHASGLVRITSRWHVFWPSLHTTTLMHYMVGCTHLQAQDVERRQVVMNGSAHHVIRCRQRCTTRTPAQSKHVQLHPCHGKGARARNTNRSAC